MPEICSDMFQYTIESLFITHAETQLNTIGHIVKESITTDIDPINNPWLVRGHQWYQGLYRRPVSTIDSIASPSMTVLNHR